MENLKKKMKNWRPISPLNVIYEIASGCIAERIKKILDILISKLNRFYKREIYM